MPRSKSIILPLETDVDVCIQAYTDDDDVRIRLPKGGFVRAGLFRFALEKAASGEKIVRGPIEIMVVNAKMTVMEVAVRLPNGEPERHTFLDEAISEIIERVDQIRALLHSYAPDAEAMARAAKRRLESRGHSARKAT